MIAFDDRPEIRFKDARDIANIISHFFDLHADLINDKHDDLFKTGRTEPTLEEISATVIGREMKKICASNENLTKRLQQILKSHIDLKAESVFVRSMVAETDGTVEKSIQLLQNIWLSLHG